MFFPSCLVAFLLIILMTAIYFIKLVLMQITVFFLLNYVLGQCFQGKIIGWNNIKAVLKTQPLHQSPHSTHGQGFGSQTFLQTLIVSSLLQAANNLIVLGREEAGAERIFQNNGVALLLQLMDTKRPELVLAAVRTLSGMCSGHRARVRAWMWGVYLSEDLEGDIWAGCGWCKRTLIQSLKYPPQLGLYSPRFNRDCSSLFTVSWKLVLAKIRLLKTVYEEELKAKAMIVYTFSC